MSLARDKYCPVAVATCCSIPQAVPPQHEWRIFMQGLEAGIHKQIIYTGLRLSLYDYLTGLSGSEEVSMPTMIACAAMTTGVGILIANPADVVQTRFIAHRSLSPLNSQSYVALSSRPTSAVRQLQSSRISAQPGKQQTRQYSSFAANRIPFSWYGQRFMSNSTTGVSSQSQNVTGGRNYCAQRCDAQQCSFQHPLVFSHTMCSAQLRLRGSHSACSVKAQSGTASGPTSITGVPLSSASRAYGVILRCVSYA
jgi:hypothetical protein